MKKILIAIIVLISTSAYAVDFTDTDTLYGWDGAAQFFPTYLEFKTQLETDLGFVAVETDPVFIAADSFGISTADIANWDGKEDSLGDPGVDGYVLSSTALGVRSWVAQSAETDPVFSAADSFGISTADIANWDGKEDGLGNPSVTGYVLSSTDAGIRSWIDAGGGTDDQTATEVPFTPFSTIAATTTQAAIEEVFNEATGGTDDQTAAEVPIADIDELFTATSVETALKENRELINAGGGGATTIVQTVDPTGTGETTVVPSEAAVGDALALKQNVSAMEYVDVDGTTIEKASGLGTEASPWLLGVVSDVYEPADATILKDADIGTTAQAYDADLTAWAAISPSTKATVKADTNSLSWSFNATELAAVATAPAAHMMFEVPVATEWTTGELICDGTSTSMVITVGSAATPYGTYTDITGGGLSTQGAVTVTGWTDPSAGTNLGAWVSTASAGTATSCRIIFTLVNN